MKNDEKRVQCASNEWSRAMQCERRRLLKMVYRNMKSAIQGRRSKVGSPSDMRERWWMRGLRVLDEVICWDELDSQPLLTRCV
jgi:hypothetical protein